MFPNLEGFSSSVSYSRVDTRFEQYSSKSLDQNPISVMRDENKPTAKPVEETAAPSRADNFDVDALVSTIWDFARGRIAQAAADGADEDKLDSLWNAAEKGVRQGFGEAKEVLESLGELGDALEMKIDSAFGKILDRIEDQDLNPPSASTVKESAPVEAPQKRAIDRAIKIDQYERQTFALNLTTQEGDKVLIRAINEEASSLDDQRFGQRSSTLWTTQQTSGYELIIQGDLNEKERSDLDALLADVNELAEEFYEGDYETAFEMATELSIDGTSLQTLDLSMKEVEQKSAAVYSEMAGQPAVLPKGLQPLRAYAEKLIAAQDNWQKAFEAPKAFIDALSNHPSNRGGLESVARNLLW